MATSKTVGTQVSRGPASAPLTPQDAKAFEATLLEKMDALLDEAARRRFLPAFANVVTWKLAEMVVHSGPYVAGDVMRLLGQHLCDLAEEAQAAREAQEAKEQGRRPQ